MFQIIIECRFLQIKIIASFFTLPLRLNRPWRLLDTFEPRHDKTNTVRLRPAWIQTSLRIRAV
jgi:hypothetical protein